jgi:hypothetical protein
MSPTEFDLRAALRDGEGDEPNADQLILHGRARVAQRRTRILSAAAVVAVVTGLGGGIALLAHGGSGGDSASNAGGAGAASSQADSAYGAAGGTALAPAAGVPQAASSLAERGLSGTLQIPCPAALPQYLLPGGGGTGQFGADSPLFGKPVRAVVVCAYGPAAKATDRGAAHPARLELADGAATRLAASLDATPSATATGPHCPSSPAGPYRFAIIGLTADGARAGTVTAELTASGCTGQVTNGTAVRYGWSPPADLRSRLLALSRRAR